MATLTIVRGLPGSGKSTIARKLVEKFPGTVHVEADMFMIDEYGNYKFDSSKLKFAHSECQRVAEEYLMRGRDVVVSNTFTMKWEAEPYLIMADRYKAKVEIIVASGNFENIHGAGSDVIERMKARWEEF